MKRNSKNIIITLILVSILSGCIGYKNQLFTGAGDTELARKNVITDFVNSYKTPKKYLKERDGEPFDVFRVYEREFKGDPLVLSISPATDGIIPLSIKDTLGKVPNSQFPNRFEIKEGKLFVWKDSITPLKKDILDVMNRFRVLDSVDVKRELGLLPEDYEDTRVVTIDHELKSTHYYICRNNITKYKKVVTNKAIGYYDPPNLKCNTP